MTLIFKLIVTFIFLAHIALAAYILFRQDDDSIIENLFGAVIWTVCVMFYGILFLINAIEDKGIRYGETLYSSPLYPFQASSGDSVYLEIDDNAYRFKLSEDSTAQTPDAICRRDYLEEGDMPYCEYVSIAGLTHQLPKPSTARGIEVCRAKSADVFFLTTVLRRAFFRRKRHAEAALFDYQVVTSVW